MKHIVFVLGDFFPNPTANGYCVQKIIDQLKKKYKVTVICYNTNNSEPYLKVDGITLFRLTNWRNIIRNYATEKHDQSQNKLLRLFFKMIITMTRIIRVLISSVAWPTSEKWFIKKSLRVLKNLKGIEKIDAVVTVSIPFESHIVGLRYQNKYKNTKWITYTLDQFSDHKAIHKYVINKKKRNKLNVDYECKINNLADINFVTESRKKWCESIAGMKIEKVREISFPLMAPLTPSRTKTFNKDKNKIHLLYAGTFYKEIRNPEYFLNLFINVDNEKLVLHLFTKGDCEDIINKHVKLSDGKIINHGAVTVDKVHSALQQADILVNVGNVIQEQLPSKIYEYISAGKPIINLFSNNLSYENIYKDYPSYLQINQDDPNIEQNKMLFLNFCLTNKNRVFNYNELEKLYKVSTPEYIAGIFEAYFN